MKVLVTGANGQLGHAECTELQIRNMDYRGIDIDDVDVCDELALRQVVRAYAPDAVIHCAAYTAVDKAESEAEKCRRINVYGAWNVANICAELNAKLVFLSTDYVFPGNGDKPYEVYSPITPLNVYGHTKAEAEHIIRKRMSRYFIVRTSWLFGQNGGNFVQTMLRLGKEKKDINVVDDQIGSPTYAPDLVHLLCDMMQTEKYGIYHATNEGFCSWYQFACEIIGHAGIKCSIHPVSSDQYPTAAKRPRNSRLSKASLDYAGFSRLPEWRDALRSYMAIREESV